MNLESPFEILSKTKKLIKGQIYIFIQRENKNQLSNGV